MLRSMISVPLLWGLCVLFATSIPETKSADVTIEVNNTTKQPTTARVKALHVTAWNPEPKHEDVSTTAPAVQNVSLIVANETSETTVSKKANVSDSSRDHSVVVTAVAAATSSSGLLASTEALEAPAATSTRGEANPSTNVTTATTEAQPSATATVAMTLVTTATTETQPSATATVAMTSVTTATTEAQPSPAVNTATGGPSAAVSTALTETQPSTVATTAKDQVQPSPSVTTATGEVPTLNFTMTDALNHTTDHLRLSSTSSFTTKISASGATVAASSLQPTSTTGNTSALPSTSSLNTQNVSIFSQNVRLPTSSSPTSRKAETFPSSSTELSSTHKSVSNSSTLSSTAEPSNTSSTTGNSTSPAGSPFPLSPKWLSGPTTRSAPAATVTPYKPTNNSPYNQTTQPCSTRSMANQCLIIIATLATLATVFMVSTTVLCAKLSTRNYKVKKTQSATELMCISALLPEKTYTYRRQRNPVSNGVLVLPGGGDSDDEGGDNLTLSSFLPDNDCYV